MRQCKMCQIRGHMSLTPGQREQLIELNRYHLHSQNKQIVNIATS